MQDMLTRFRDVELLKKSAELQAAKDDLNHIKQFEGTQQKIQEMEKRMLWADIQEMEANVATIQKEIDTYDETIAGFNERIRKEETIQATLKEQEDDSNVRIASLESDLILQQEESSRCGQDYDLAMQPVLNARESKRDAQRTISQSVRRMNDYREKIDMLTKKMEKKANDDTKKRKMEELNEKIEAMSQRREEIQGQKNELEQRQQELVIETGKLKETEMMVSSEKEQLGRDLYRIKTKLEDAKRAENDRRFRFGKNMVPLLNSLSRYKSEYKIFCPIGDYITLKEEYRPWANAIETTMDNILSGAICNVRSQRDLSFLNKLGKESNVYNFNVIAISYTGDFEFPPQKYKTILDAFDYADPIVRKALISAKAVESIILARDAEEVKDITGRGQVRALPYNCSMIVTENGDVHRVKNGNPNMSANRKEAHGLLAKNSKIRIERLEAERRQKEEQMNGFVSRLAMLSKQRGDKDRQKLTVDREYSKQDRIIRDLEINIKKNRDLLDRITADEHDNELEQLHKEKEEAMSLMATEEQNKRAAEARLEELKERIRSGEESVEIAKQKLDQIKKKVEETINRLEQLKGTKDIAEKMNRSRLIITKAQENIKLFEEKREHKYNERNTIQEVVNASIEKLGPETRVMERLDKRACKLQCERMKESLQQEMQKMGLESIEAVEKRWNDAMNAYRKSENEYKAVKREGQQMDDLNKRQKLSYNELRNEAQQQICKRFTMFLSQRKAEGKVAINHSSKEVSLAVKMDSTNEVAQSQVSNIRVLSGGEKSFVTLSLIMATAHIIESPFFIMDEFDVFMDEANRVVSLHTIIDTARQEKKQFIFITPHNLETVVKEMSKEGRNDISIFKLNDHQYGRRACNCLL